MRLIAAVLAASIAAEPVATPAGTEPAPEDALDRAKRLYEEGKAHFETGDYQRAVDIWTDAYSSVPDTPENALSKALLIYNIAAAHKKLYDVDHDVAHLRRSRILLTEFQDNIPALYEDEAEAQVEREKIGEKIAEIDALLEDAERKDSLPRNELPPPVDAPEPDRRSRPLIISGAVLAGAGAVGLAVMGGGLAMGSSANDISDIEDDDIEGRRDQFQRGRTGNVMAIVGGSVGGALLVTGAILLAVGLTKRKRGTTAFAPSPGGFTFRARF